MEQSEGFELKGKENYVYKLKESLYNLKQLPRQWCKKFESVMGKQGFKKTTSNHCDFVQRFSIDDFIIFCCFNVDNMLLLVGIF